MCHEATIYDYASPARRQLFADYLKRRQGAPLKATGIRKRIDCVRSFFRYLQKYAYEVNGHLQPRLEINWNPVDALALPKYVRAQLQPNPRNIEEEAWLKLVWTACTLNAEMVQDIAPGTRMYPLPMVRAMALVWVTGCCRSDEIRRLPLECIRESGGRQKWWMSMASSSNQQSNCGMYGAQPTSTVANFGPGPSIHSRGDLGLDRCVQRISRWFRIGKHANPQPICFSIEKNSSAQNFSTIP